MSFREKVIDVIDGGCDCYFAAYGEKMAMIQTINYLFDKYDLDEICSNGHLSHSEYKKYFKDIVKNYNPTLHKKAKQYYKENKNES